MTATQVGNGPMEVAGIKCCALLDSSAGSSYAPAALLERTGAKPHHSGLAVAIQALYSQPFHFYNSLHSSTK